MVVVFSIIEMIQIQVCQTQELSWLGDSRGESIFKIARLCGEPAELSCKVQTVGNWLMR